MRAAPGRGVTPLGDQRADPTQRASPCVPAGVLAGVAVQWVFPTFLIKRAGQSESRLTPPWPVPRGEAEGEARGGRRGPQAQAPAPAPARRRLPGGTRSDAPSRRFPADRRDAARTGPATEGDTHCVCLRRGWPEPSPRPPQGESAPAPCSLSTQARPAGAGRAGGKRPSPRGRPAARQDQLWARGPGPATSSWAQIKGEQRGSGIPPNAALISEALSLPSRAPVSGPHSPGPRGPEEAGRAGNSPQPGRAAAESECRATPGSAPHVSRLRLRPAPPQQRRPRPQPRRVCEWGPRAQRGRSGLRSAHSSPGAPRGGGSLRACPACALLLRPEREWELRGRGGGPWEPGRDCPGRGSGGLNVCRDR